MKKICVIGLTTESLLSNKSYDVDTITREENQMINFYGVLN